ncbi:MAG: right-handed parallel beta-helix repeat-containing protein, partial [Planctomycetaceae bacterium]|nr:right-handed parallel beta-helix repeat-containing protein [Planctomycetaceae bacterium]
VLKNTWGTPPAAGIDFEPNRPDEQLTDCIMRRCRIENNFGNGIEFYLANLLQSTIPISIRLEQCVVLSGKRYGFNFVIEDTPELTVKGCCELIDCCFENCEAGGIAIVQKSAKGVAVTMKNTEIVHCGKEQETAPIRFKTKELGDFGGIDLGSVQITDNQERLPVKLTDFLTIPKQITGQLQLKRNDQNNQTENLTINELWLAQHYPIRAIPRLKADTKDFVPLKTKLSETDSTFPVIWLRRQGTFWVYAEKGTPIRFTLAVRKIGKRELTSYSGTLTSPNGKVEKFTIPVESVQKFEHKINSVSETGVYILQTNVGSHAVRLVQCNQPVAFPANPYLNLISSPCRFYFAVPAESKEFGIRIRGGDSEMEAVKASVVNPAGQTVWSKDTINETVQFDQTRVDENIGNNNNIAGIWQIVLERPSRLVFEDFSVTILGVPPIFHIKKPEHSD